MEEMNELEIDLLRVMKALLKKAWLIILVAAVLGGSVFAYGKATYVPEYTTQTTLFVHYTNSREIALGENAGIMSYNSIDDARKLVTTSIAVLKTNSTLDEILTRSGVDMTTSDLSGKISAASVSGTELFTVTVTDTSAADALTLATVIGDVLPEQMAAVNASCTLEIMDEASEPKVCNASDALNSGVKFAVVGAILVCAVVAVLDIVAQVKEEKAKKQTN